MFQNKKFAIILLVICMTLGGRGLLFAREPQAKNVTKNEKVPVEIAVVGKNDISSSLESTGTVEANLDAVISAEVGGELIKVFVEEGTHVKKNTRLLEIDSYILKLQRDRGSANEIGTRSGYEYIKRIAVLQVETRLKQAEAAARSAKAQYEHVVNIARTAVESRLAQAKANRDMAAARLQQLKTGARYEERQQALAAKKSAKANFENARRNYDRITKLLADEAVSTQQHDDAKNNMDAAQAGYTTALEAWNLLDKGARVEDINAAQANLAQAEAVFKLAEKEATTESWKKDIELAKSAWEQAEANVVLRAEELKQRAFEADIRRAEARFHDAGANLKILQRQVDRAVIRAPFAGVAYDRRVELGETVAPGQPLIKVMQIDKVKVSSSISETSSAGLEMGQKVAVTVDAYPGEKFEGTIVELSPAIDPTSRTMLIKVELDNQDNLLKPGMFARLKIVIENHEQVVVIPKDALIVKDNRRYVYLIEDGKAVIKDVELGLATKYLWEVKAGVKPGDKVVLIGQSNLADGKEVTIVNQ